VYACRRWLYEEIIRNKFFSNYYHSCFIHIVSFELELTSYDSGTTLINYRYLWKHHVHVLYSKRFKNNLQTFWCTSNVPVLV
jgi:hypothetical protein